jgi:RimJ/RimL family protein N-acetyltransferase
MIEADQLPTLTAPRVTLRWLTGQDVDALYGIFSTPEVMTYWSCPPYQDIAEAKELLTSIESGFETKTLFQWGVASNEDDSIIGTCTLFQLDAGNRRAEIGYVLGREYWGKGYMGEALMRLMAFCFEDLDLVRLEADVDPRNSASIRSLERLGFQREGFLRERWIVDGKIMDSLFYGLLRRDWEAL